MLHKMNVEQQELVTQNMDLVEKVIWFDIRRNPANPDYDHDDLYQAGCVGLCKAAVTHDKTMPFRAYAKTVIYHEIIMYCRGINRHGAVDSIDAMTEAQVERIGTSRSSVEDTVVNDTLIELMREAGKRYSGVTLRGIEALELKLKGFSGADIARMYGVKPNQVSAWISRAKTRLMKDQEFSKEIL